MAGLRVRCLLSMMAADHIPHAGTLAMWFIKRHMDRRLSKSPTTSRPSFRPRLEALEDRLMLSRSGGGSGIDPDLLYSYSMSSGDGWAIAVDGSRNAYIAGGGGMV